MIDICLHKFPISRDYPTRRSTSVDSIKKVRYRAVEMIKWEDKKDSFSSTPVPAGACLLQNKVKIWSKLSSSFPLTNFVRSRSIHLKIFLDTIFTFTTMWTRSAVIALFILATVSYGARRGEYCASTTMCYDTGLTCTGARCYCYTDLSPKIARYWACNTDADCTGKQSSRCIPSEECPLVSGYQGYCNVERRA